MIYSPSFEPTSFEPFTPSFYANRIRSDESHCKPGCSQLDVEDALSNVFESNAAGVMNFSIV